MSKLNAIMVATATTVFIPATSNAAPVFFNEIPFDSFSDNLASPTLAPAGFDGVTGTLIVQDEDYVTLNGLGSGAQLFEYSFLNAPNTEITSISLSYAEDGNPLGSPITIDSGNTMGSFLTSSNFNGMLTLALVPQGSSVERLDLASYSISLSANPVPLPASAWLFASGLAGLGAIRARRKAKRRA